MMRLSYRSWLLVPAISALGLLLAAAAPGDASALQATPPATPRVTPTPVRLTPAPTWTPLPRGVEGRPDIGDPTTPGLGNTGYDVQHYDLRFDIDMEGTLIKTVATLQVTATLEDLARFSLDYAGPPVREVLVNGVPALWQHQDLKLWVALPAPPPAGQTFVVTVRYAGWPVPFSSPYMPFLGLGVYADPEERFLFAFNEPDGARAWFPCNDHPLDKATFAFTLTVPADLTAVANGEPEPPVDNGDGTRTFVWRMDYPMATYLALVAVANYAVLEDAGPRDIPLRHYYLTDFSSEDEARASFGFTGQAIAFFEELFGPYPFDGYGHVMTPQNRVGMETQSMTIVPAGTVGQRMVVHELAHQWFGDLISPASWADIWLNEGFATYAEVLWTEHVGGPEAAAGQLGFREIQVLAGGEEAPLAQPAVEDLFGTNSYQKGAWVLHMLRRQIGDQAFFDTLRAYLERFGGGTAATEDFWEVAEEISGQDLDAFFEQWAYRPGNPSVSLYWTAAGEVLACQESEPFVLDLPLAFVNDASDGDGEGSDWLDVAQLSIDEAVERTAFPLRFEADQLWIDPAQDVLAGVTLQPVDALPDACP
jgi:aminopeptidase N